MAEEAPHAEHGHVLPDFGKKIGPLPTWGWAVLVIAAYFAYTHYAGKKAAVADSGVDTTDGTDTVDGSTADLLGGSGSGTDTISSNGASATATPTNQAWYATALQALLGTGESYTDSVTALGDYLTGVGTDSAQDSIINKAVGLVGLPPTPVAVVSAYTNNPDGSTTDGVTGVTTSSSDNPIVGTATSGLDPSDPVVSAGNETDPDGSVWYRVRYQNGPPYQVELSGPSAAAAPVAPKPVSTPVAPTKTVSSSLSSGEKVSQGGIHARQVN